MTKSEILEKLKAGEVSIEFIKANGTLRNMRATLSESLFSYEAPIQNGSTGKKTSDFSLPVWDMEANGWRSFRWDSLKVVDNVEIPAGSLVSAA
jgi:hypothetical protein